MRVSPGPEEVGLVNTQGVQIDPATSTDTATETTLGLIKNKTDNLDVVLSTRATETTLSGIKTKTDGMNFTGTGLNVHQNDTSWIVSGLTATGSAPTANPVSVSGVDGGGLKRHLLTDIYGNVKEIPQGIYEGSTPSLSAGNYRQLQLTMSGALKTSSLESIMTSAREGRAFNIFYTAQTNAAENNRLYLLNTHASRKVRLLSCKFYTSSAYQDLTVRWYVATGTVTGTTVSVINRNPGSATTSILSALSSILTGVTRGAQYDFAVCLRATTAQTQNLNIVLDPGSAIVFTGAATGNNTNMTLVITTEDEI